MPSGGVLFLRAQTSLHPGTGASVGAIDLPIQRERHTDWPMIQSSSLKGVLRDVYRAHLVRTENLSHTDADGHDEVVTVFGPPTGARDEHYAGALTISDARILAFPVRSAKGVFAWVTCPGVIRRLKADFAIAEMSWNIPIPTDPTDEQAIVHQAVRERLEVSIGPEPRILLEDLALTPSDDADGSFANWLFERVSVGEGSDGDAARVVIVSDNAFSHLVKHATEIVQRIRLTPETKTVTKGALFTEELLPPETIMYAMLLAEQPRNPNDNLPFADDVAILRSVKERCDGKPLQVGGDETIGKGWCWAKVFLSQEQ